MATISLLPSGSLRVQIRRKNFDKMSAVFATEQEAIEYKILIESQMDLIDRSQKEHLPVDMTKLYASLHPDLQAAAKNLPIFIRVRSDIHAHSLSLSRLIDDFMVNYKKKDKNIINRLKWWSDNYGSIYVNEFSEDIVRDGINKLLISGPGGDALAPQTTNRFKANLSSVFEYGKEKYHLKLNPCRGVRSKPEGKGRQRFLTIEQEELLLEAARNSAWDKLYVLVLMTATTGARRSEILNLTYKQVFANEDYIFLGDSKNGNARRFILIDQVKQQLKRFKQQDSDYLFFACPRKLHSLVPYDFRKEWEQALEEAGLSGIDETGENLVFHSLRHSFCSNLANDDVEMHHIAKLAAHKSLQTTMRYIHHKTVKLTSVVNNTFSSLK